MLRFVKALENQNKVPTFAADKHNEMTMKGSRQESVEILSFFTNLLKHIFYHGY